MQKARYGDHNISDSRGKLVENFIEEKNLICMNNGEGTRLNPSGSLSHLDVVFCSSCLGPSIVCEVGDDSMGSDHYPLIIHYDFNVQKIEMNTTPRFCYKKANWSKFKSLLELDPTIRSPVVDVDEAYNCLVLAFKNARDISIPLITGPFKHKYSPFWNQECSRVKRGNVNYGVM